MIATAPIADAGGTRSVELVGGARSARPEPTKAR